VKEKRKKRIFRPIHPRAGLSGAGFRQTGSGYQENRGTGGEIKSAL